MGQNQSEFNIKKLVQKLFGRKTSNNNRIINLKSLNDFRILNSSQSTLTDMSLTTTDADHDDYDCRSDFIKKNYIDDLSHDSIASSFIFASPADFNTKTKIFYSNNNINTNEFKPPHVRVYHDIYYF